MRGVTEGRVVHFILPDNQHRAAIIVKVVDKEAGIVNLSVFTDWSNDGRYYDTRGMVHEQNVAFADQALTLKPRTWHWPEKE